MKERYIYRSTCTNVHENKLEKYTSGLGKDAIFTTDSNGWYITIGGEICIYVGKEKPAIEIGQRLKLTIEGVES